jgi:hypothetical protein
MACRPMSRPSRSPKETGGYLGDTMMRSKIFATVSLLAGGLFAATTAMAGKPLIIRTILDFDFPVVECDDFEVWSSGKEIDTEKYFFNDAGEAVRLLFSFHVTESEYYNFDHPEISVSQGKNGAGENATTDIDLTTGDYHNGFGAFRLTIPGIGRVLWSTGTCFYDASADAVDCRGKPYIFLEGETGPALCEALAYSP